MGFIRPRALGAFYYDAAGNIVTGSPPAYDPATGGGGPPNGELVVGNSIVTFNEYGHAIGSRPVPVSDDTIIRDGGPFDGWTIRQQAAFYAAQGTALLTEAVTSTGTVGDDGVIDYDPDALAADQARLRAEAQSDPTVAAALEQLQTGAFRGEAGQAAWEAQQLEAVAGRERELVQFAQEHLQNLLRAGAEFTDTIPASRTPTPGMISTAQYLEDEISEMRGGPRTHELLAKALIPVRTRDVSDDIVLLALDQVSAQGGDVTGPTTITDRNTGAAVAVVQQLPNGDVEVLPPSSANLSRSVNNVTGFIDDVAGFLDNVSTEVRRISHAVSGAAAGAQAGYHAPTDWKPIAIGAAAVGAGLLLIARLSK